MPAHVLKALQKYAAKDTLQIMTPSQTSDILHNNVALIEQLKPNQKIELLRYLIKGLQILTPNSLDLSPILSTSYNLKNRRLNRQRLMAQRQTVQLIWRRPLRRRP